jgi:hypothetical protein
MKKFEVYKFLELNEDRYMLLEQNDVNNYLARFYSISISFETFNFGIYNTRNITGFNKIGASNDSDWKIVSYEDFLDIKKQIGKDLQEKIDNLLEMIKTETYNCYEGNDYIIHIPRYQFRIAGPKFKYSFSEESSENYDSYFIKTTDNDDQLEQTLNKAAKIGKEKLDEILEIWPPFWGLLLSESKYF